MFILYAIPIGLIAGLLLGGRIERLGDLRFHWAWLAIAGLVAQIVLFSPAVAGVVGEAGPALYVASTLAVFVAVVRNWRIPGLAIVAIGAACNLLAIAANGGIMPAARTRSRPSGWTPPGLLQQRRHGRSGPSRR